MKAMRKRKSEHKRDIDTRLNRQPDIYPLIITTTCFVCMNRFPSPLGILDRNIGGQIISIRICVSCQKNMSLYNGISTSAFTHITEDPKGEFQEKEKIDDSMLTPAIMLEMEMTNKDLMDVCDRLDIHYAKKITKKELVDKIYTKNWV